MSEQEMRREIVAVSPTVFKGGYNIRELVLEMLGDNEKVVFFENPSYDEAIVGLSEKNKIIYDYDRMVECLMTSRNLTSEQAIEFIDKNTSCLSEQENYPIIVRLF